MAVQVALHVIGGERVEMEQKLFVIAAVVTIVGGGGLIGILIGILKNKELIKNFLADWTRRGRKVIYIWVFHNECGDVILYLFLCGEETSLFYPSTYENCEPYILAMRQIHYDTSYRSNSDRDDPIADWTAMGVEPLSEDESPCLFQLIGECGFRFRLPNKIGVNEISEAKTVSASFKFKTELKECLRKCEIKYVKKASNPQDRWKAKDK